MKNIPRIFVSGDLKEGKIIPASSDIAHYLGRVMRRRDCIAFGGGMEFNAMLSDDGKNLIIGNPTGRMDPSGNIKLLFAPIKRTDDLINMATQMGVATLQPVITERTVAAHINWDRMRKIAIEAAEQSNRNSVPDILPAIKFSDLDLRDIVFADERAAHGGTTNTNTGNTNTILVGPEGGFSDAEFASLDKNGARGVSLGKTILRAELAAAIAITRMTP